MVKYDIKSLKPGYICAVHQGFLGKLEMIFNEPATNYDHFFLLYRCDEKQDDWAIIESIGSGVRVGKLSWYSNYFDVDIFKPNSLEADEICARAADISIDYGRKSYDWFAVVYVTCVTLREIFKQLIKFKRPRVSYTVYKRSSKKRVICTELVGDTLSEAGFDIFDMNYLASPPNFMQQYLNGKVLKVCQIPAKKDNLLYRIIYRAGYGIIKQSM